jgi:hypothetical protein
MIAERDPAGATPGAMTPGDKALVDTLLRLCLALALLGLATTGMTETDIWGHFAIGLDMLREHRFFWVDPYSFTHDQPWINHEWLWDLSLAAIYRAIGLPGVLVVRAMLIGMVLWIVDRSTGHAPAFVRLATLVIVTAACFGQWQSTRPQIATLTLYAVTLAHLSAWWLPLVFVLWTNVHGGWLFGLAALGIYTLAHRNRRQFAIFTASLLGTLINPYGVRLWLSLLAATGRGWHEVAEWAPIWSHGAGWPIFGVWLGLMLIPIVLRRYVHAEWWTWVWAMVSLLAATRAMRLVAMAAITIAVLLPRDWRTPQPTVAIDWTSGRRIAAALTLAGAIVLALFFAAPSASCFPPAPTLLAPESDAVAFIRQSDVHGRLLVYFDFGEYAIFHLRDRLKVSIDNRRETVYSETLVQDHLRFYQGKDPDYPMRLGADAIWLPRQSPALAGLTSRGWKQRFEGPRTVILLRSNGPLVIGKLKAGSPCFPNP